MHRYRFEFRRFIKFKCNNEFENWGLCIKSLTLTEQVTE